MTLKKFFTLSMVSAAVLLLSALPLTAQTAGYDLLQTGAGAKVTIAEGTINLQGQQIDGSLGNTDTIMHRTQDTVGGGTTPVEVTALFMKSTASFTHNSQSVDLYVTINNSAGKVSTSALPQPDTTSSSGTVTVYGGGTFDSSISITADLIYVKAGTSVTNSANWVDHKADSTAITLTSTASPWSSTPPAGYPSSPSFPSGGFYPSPVHNGPHPVVPAKCGGTVSPAQPSQPTSTAAKGGTLSAQPNAIAPIKVCAVATQQ